MQETLSSWFGRWIRTPWATLLPLLLLLPFLLSGAFRFTTGQSLGAGLLFWLVICGLAGAAARRFGMPKLTASEGSDSLAAPGALAAALVLVCWMYRLWWTPLFEGMPNTYQGVDVGNHVKLFMNFVNKDHKQYEGFVGLYALMHWYWQVLYAFGESATRATYYSLRFAHYATLLSLPIALSLVAYPSFARLKTRRVQISAVALSLPLQLALLALLIFPVVQYYQAEGFYSQTIGLYPVVLGWLFYGLTEDVRARFLIMMFWLLVQRFTYGLNLGDTLLTCAYLVIWEAHALKPLWLRWGARLFVPVACYVAYVIYLKLYPLRGAPGYFIDHAVSWVVPSQMVLSLLLLSARGVLESAGVVVTEASVRLWRYAGVFGLVNGTLATVYFMYDQPRMYYAFKWSLYAFVLVALAAAGPLCAVAAHLVERAWSWSSWREQLRLLVALMIASVLVLAGYSYGYASYRPLALERYRRTVPNEVLFSHFEPKIEEFIAETLAAKKLPFGGYYDPFWSRMFLMNVLHAQFVDLPDYHYNGQFKFSQPLFVLEPGRCYFTMAELEAYPGGGLTPMRQQVRELLAKSTKCTEFVPAWHTNTLRVCASCL